MYTVHPLSYVKFWRSALFLKEDHFSEENGRSYDVHKYSMELGNLRKKCILSFLLSK